ncbi:hypothetical protein JYT20_01240 [Rhodothermus sp. AH-315-K08]|nr:hypothetical protein [Rhodothermus sp. AH-315-K08]
MMLILAGGIATAVIAIGIRVLFDLVTVKVAHLPPSVSLYSLAFALVLLTAGLSVSLQSRQLIKTEPAEVLRTD